MSRRSAAAGALALAALAVSPAVASAHGLVGRQDLPIPRWLFAWGAAVVLVVSFVGLSVLWQRPRLERARATRVATLPAWTEAMCGAIGVGTFALTVYAGLAGSQSSANNLTPTVVYVAFWVALPIASALLGDVFMAFNPWRATARACAWLVARVGIGTPAPLAYPAWLGRWPAVTGVLAFVWVELIDPSRDDPSRLAIMALIYAAICLVAMSLYGIETWTRRGDAFAVYFGLFALLAPLTWRARTLWRRAPLSGAPRLEVIPGTVALLCTMIGSTSFDGLSQGQLWTGEGGIAPSLQARFIDVGLSAQSALEVTFTIGLFALIGIVAGVYRLGVTGMRGVGGGHTADELARRFVHALLPIALAYVIAHYFSLLVYQGQALAFLASDPLGDGSDYLGTASATIDYGVIGANGIWYVQVAALVFGHAAGLALAHDRALVLYDRARQATRSQYWMLAVMVAFTCLGLWLLSAAAQ